MYIPMQFEETRIEIMHELIRARPLATLITQSVAGIEANHIPLVLQNHPEPFGALWGHVARANLIWQQHPEDSDVLAIFLGPESYITPSWYSSKAESGNVVPTWNYVTVHAKGRLRIIEDAQRIRTQLEALAAHNESGFDRPWEVTDAPRDFTEKLIGSIVGFEIVISELKGKWKVSQNRSPADRTSVIGGLISHGHDEMAKLVKSSGDN